MSFINVLFKRVTTAIRGTEAIEDGKILLDYERPSIYVDNGSTRVELTPRDTALSKTSTNAIANNALTNSIINTTAGVNAITANNIPCGTKPVKELITSLNGFKFGMDDNGNYGYYKVGADSVTPFKTKPDRLVILNGSVSESLYGNQLNYNTLGYTKMDITGYDGFSVPVRGKGTYTQNTLNIDISNLTGFIIDNLKGSSLEIVLHD